MDHELRVVIQLSQRLVRDLGNFFGNDVLEQVFSETVQPEVVKICDDIEEQDDWANEEEEQVHKVADPVFAGVLHLINDAHDPGKRDKNDGNTNEAGK